MRMESFLVCGIAIARAAYAASSPPVLERNCSPGVCISLKSPILPPVLRSLGAEPPFSLRGINSGVVYAGTSGLLPIAAGPYLA